MQVISADPTQPIQWSRLNKVNPGFLPIPPIPTMVPANGIPAPIAAIFVAPAPLPGVGVVPPVVLPFLNDTNSTLRQSEIGYLARWYNDDFGIVAGDNEATQLGKLKRYMSGY